MNTTQSKTVVNCIENSEITYKRKTAFRGLVSWWSKDRCDAIGKDLVITTLENFDRVILNGEVIYDSLKTKE